MRDELFINPKGKKKDMLLYIKQIHTSGNTIYVIYKNKNMNTEKHEITKSLLILISFN